MSTVIKILILTRRIFYCSTFNLSNPVQFDKRTLAVNQISPLPLRKRGRPKVESDASRQAKIVAEAEALFLQQGFIGTTMDEIAANCRMSKQTLYRIFPSKLDLIAASVHRHRFSMVSLPTGDKSLPLDEALAQIFKIDITANEDHNRLSFLNFVWRESAQIPDLGQILFDHGVGPSRDDLAHWLAHQAESGTITLRDPQAAARILMDMIFGTILQKALGDHPWPGTDDRQAYIHQCIDIFLHGVAVPKKS
jgi:AcrR family transcriptional regulator